MKPLETHPSRAALADYFLMLEYEAHQNGNCNFCFFPESRARFVGMALRLRSVLTPYLEPASWGDDADEAICLLSGMIEDSPRDLPITDDERYQALRRELVRTGVLA